jgi:hypothetical protein
VKQTNEVKVSLAKRFLGVVGKTLPVSFCAFTMKVSTLGIQVTMSLVARVLAVFLL